MLDALLNALNSFFFYFFFFNYSLSCCLMLLSMRMVMVKKDSWWFMGVANFLYSSYIFNYLIILLYYLKWDDNTKIMFILLFLNASFFGWIHFNFTHKLQDKYKPVLIYGCSCMNFMLSTLIISEFPLILKIVSRIIYGPWPW